MSSSVKITTDIYSDGAIFRTTMKRIRKVLDNFKLFNTYDLSDYQKAIQIIHDILEDEGY